MFVLTTCNSQGTVIEISVLITEKLLARMTRIPNWEVGISHQCPGRFGCRQSLSTEKSDFLGSLVENLNDFHDLLLIFFVL